MTIRGTDIASHQGTSFPFAALKQQGFEFSIIKASGGHDYRNPLRAQQVSAARAAGVEVGFYHYMFEPSYGTPGNPSGGDVEKEVTNFIEAVRPFVQEGTTLWLDVEEYPKSVGFSGDLGGWIDYFCERVSDEFDCLCGIYCATWYLVPTGLNKDSRLAKWPFWMASWQDALPPVATMAPWRHVTMWQYNADGFDKDMFMDGGIDKLRELGAYGATVGLPGNEIQTGILEDGRPYALIVFEGLTHEVLGADVADLGISVRSATEANVILDQSVQGNEFKGWRVRQ